MPSVVKIEVTSQLAIPKQQLTPKLKRFLHDKLFILNSEYIIKERLGKPLYDVPKFFDLIEEDDEYVRLPRGFLAQLTTFFDKEATPYRVVHHHPEFAPREFDSAITLTNIQEQLVVQAMTAGSGVIVVSPGSGKTIMGLELITRHDTPALILTHRKQLLDQWVERIQQYLALPKRHIGRYSAAYKKPSEQISVGLLQSFARAEDLSALAETFGVIIVDECHHIPAKTFRAVVTQLNAEHIYGLTATPKRKHNDQALIHLYIGDIVAELSGRTQTPEFGISVHETALELPFDWRTDQSELLAKVICYDTTRNHQLVQDILRQTSLGRRTLVLSERREHLKILELYLRGQANTVVFTGDDTTGKRTAKLDCIKQGDYEVLLATGQLFGEGMDVDNIETLVLAFPFAFEGKLVQYIGRLLHSTQPRQLIDYRDKQVEALERQYKQRQRYYKKLETVA